MRNFTFTAHCRKHDCDLAYIVPTLDDADFAPRVIEKAFPDEALEWELPTEGRWSCAVFHDVLESFIENIGLPGSVDPNHLIDATELVQEEMEHWEFVAQNSD